jgi:hypothetical protein
MFMSPEASAVPRPVTSGAVVGASGLCLLAVVAITVFPGWAMGRL